ncbi:MAG: hypothetical protein IPK82_32945 [Polyangiaceae bacterium]|nr:hypothetical protein [Polyangiaceae bacterium]
MVRFLKKRFVLWVTCGALAIVPAAALAQSPQLPGQTQVDSAAKKEARELANQGYEHFQAGDYKKAVVLFEQAEAKFHAPTIMYMWGQAHELSGGLVEAQALYKRIVEETLPSDAPQEFRDAQTKARSSLDGLTGRTSLLKIVLKGMTADKVKVTIDDKEISTAALTEPIPQNPGTHKIVASIGGDDGGRAVFQSVTLKEGTTKQIQLVFRPGGPAGSAIPPQSNGCASCEIGARSAATDARAKTVAAMLGALALLRRMRRRKSENKTQLKTL